VKPTSPLFSRHVNLLQLLASGLRVLPEAGASPDYLFFASFCYVCGLLRYESDIITTEPGRNLILAIYQYRRRVVPRKDIQDGFYKSHHHGWTFDDNWTEYDTCTRQIGIEVPLPSQEPAAYLSPLGFVELEEELDHPSDDAVVEVLHNHRASILSSSKTNDG